jgi:hypothetical protein
MIPQKTIYTEMTAPPYLLEQFRGTSLETLLKIIDNRLIKSSRK